MRWIAIATAFVASFMIGGTAVQLAVGIQDQSSETVPWLKVDNPPPDGAGELEWSKAIHEQYGGIADEALPDGSRPDLVAQGVAWEVDWVEKWKEAVGQAGLYAILTDKKPGVILLKRGRNNGDEAYLRCAAVCLKWGIQLRVVEVK